MPAPRGGSALLLAASLAAFLSCAPAPADRWWSHVRWLADDARQGRETGSPGYLAAAQYVAHEFERAGARPAGVDGYFQPVRFIARRIREPESFLALVRAGKVDTLALGEDAMLSVSHAAAESIEAPAVFIGYGLHLPEYGIDDLAGLDLQGKIAVVLRGAPPHLHSTVASHAQYKGERWRHLRATGAVGLVTIPDPRAMHTPWERGKLSRFEAGLSFADTTLDEHRGLIFSLTVNPDSAQGFFEGSGHRFASILALAHAGRPLPRFALPATIRARVRTSARMVESANVAGIIPGSDPELRGETIVLSAHLDHLGIGMPIAGDSIYNGAMDNASGVASLLEIARSLHLRPARRSVLLLALTGEEKGLLGSRAFAANPPAAAGHMVANLNLDMFLPLTPLRSVIGFGIDESELGDWFRAAAESSGLTVTPDPIPKQVIFVRSDQYNFVRAGVPALFPTFGPTGDSALDKRFDAWMHDRYHAPSDDLRQPVDREAAVAFTRLIERVCRAAADRAERPRWKAESFFRRFARHRADVAPAAEPGGSGPPAPPGGPKP